MYKHSALIALPKQDLARPPAALAILASACEELQVEYSIHDFNLWLNRTLNKQVWNNINDNWDSVDPFSSSDTDWYLLFKQSLSTYVTKILENPVDLISISVFSDVSACCAVELIKELNARPERNQFDIVIGGSGIRAQLACFDNIPLCNILLDQNQIDYFIFGEGEATFRKLLQKQVDYPGINNFDAEQLNDLDQYPWPSYKKLKPQDYNFPVNPEIVITGSRGCVRKCTYCDVAKYWPKFRYRSGESIANELYHYFKTLGIQHFEFSDSLINGNLKQFKLMICKLLELQTQDPSFQIKFKGQYICRNAQAMSEKDYQDLKQAGCEYLYVGVESFSQKIRYDMAKKFTNDDLDFHLRMCAKYGIKNSLLMLVGYPTETISDHQYNLQWMHEHQHYAQAGVISAIIFGYTAGILEDTPLYHLQERFNIVPEYQTASGFENSNWISLNNTTLTLKERIRRWVELSELASELGYATPRVRHYIMRYITILKTISVQKPTWKLKVV